MSKKLLNYHTLHSVHIHRQKVILEFIHIVIVIIIIVVIIILKKSKKSKKHVLFSPGIEPGTFRVLGGCDNHYTTKTSYIFHKGFVL